ncbi:MAG: hypothetical protein COA74_03310 [Gammaproteobacteria bacterium]|nr:MAG: hypothetical protein COA74_03310 [Gammaproteobacteria bacterium]
MNMKNWLSARCAQLLRELNDTPLTDNTDEVKMKLLMTAMRESSVEMFHRAAENARKDIDKLNAAAMLEDMDDANEALAGLSDTGVEKAPEPKIKLKSSVIRRVDSF